MSNKNKPVEKVTRTQKEIAVSKLNIAMGNVLKNLTKIQKARTNVIKANDVELTTNYNKVLNEMKETIDSLIVNDEDFQNPVTESAKKESFNLMA